MNAKCTDLRNCNKITCRDCRMVHILAVTERVAHTKGRDAAEAYKDTAIDTLELELQMLAPVAEKPKAKAPKASAARPGVDVAAIAASLRTLTSKEAAFELLWPLRVAELAAVGLAYGDHGGFKIPAKYRRDEQVEYLIHCTVGARLAHEAVRHGAMGAGF